MCWGLEPLEHAQQFLAPFGPISDHFHPRRHLFPASDHHQLLQTRFVTWREIPSLGILVRFFVCYSKGATFELNPPPSRRKPVQTAVPRHRSGVFAGWKITDIGQDLNWSVLRYQPDCVSIMIGLNDCVASQDGLRAFKDTYAGVAERIRYGSGAAVLLHTPNAALPSPTRSTFQG